MNKFCGTGVAMVTPFNNDGSIDYHGLEKLINYLIQGGVEYLVSLGTTGESATIDKSEKKAIWEFTAQVVDKRVPLVAGIGGNSTREITDTLRHFNTNGFAAILSVSPYYNKPTQNGIYAHYKSIAEVSPLPIILYNVPSRTGSNITAETTLRLAHDFKTIIGIKEASDNFNQFNEIMRDKPTDFLFISGDDPVALPLIAMGAAGIISVIGNAIPQIFSTMTRACLSGDFTEARPLHYRIIEFTRLIFSEGSPAGIKAALKQVGICEDYLRLPLVNVNPETYHRIYKELAALI